jgi:hypothetical protein
MKDYIRSRVAGEEKGAEEAGRTNTERSGMKGGRP